jgi:hypothetical protein
MSMLLPLWAIGDQPSNVPRIGILVPDVPATFEVPLLGSLRELGYVDGRTAFFDVRRSAGSQQEYRALADDLVRSKVISLSRSVRLRHGPLLPQPLPYHSSLAWAMP